MFGCVKRRMEKGEEVVRQVFLLFGRRENGGEGKLVGDFPPGLTKYNLPKMEKKREKSI